MKHKNSQLAKEETQKKKNDDVKKKILKSKGMFEQQKL